MTPDTPPRRRGYGPDRRPDRPDIVAHLRWEKLDVGEVLARTLDGSRFEEFKPRYGDELVCGWGSICGFRTDMPLGS